ncbi:LysR family transcriptional regulator [Motilimonas sp. 1_MG-2023]|uniref:LysR family transcriptional regulator n=1 Tax=Motilimonas sp. 1_MG-2023 TaxID=3062672 RepID=UPI0026E3BF5D|nr:LysR family transcriptional regulator [Motilimonas sp. 1_MG-2023]MDO6526287.1 LysR family transcriptional regulator [Motilimonas sp. 1_MG-2023]
MIEIKHLNTLVALRRCGSLVEAAERLFLTQSALSHQIKDLEDKLNTRLFIRKTRPIRFTVAGQRLLTLADDILPNLASAERDISRLNAGEAGRLHMAIECHSCFQWLMPAIDKFRDSWPEVELDLSSGFSFAPLPALARGDLDLVVTSDPKEITGLRYIPLFSYQPMLAISRHHTLASKAFVEPEDIASEILITYPVETDRLDIFSLFLDPAGVEPTGIRQADMTIMMLQLVASGRGVAALPNWALTEYLERDYVLAKPLGKEGLWNTLYAAIREEQADLPFMSDFLKTAVTSSFDNLKGIKRV